MSDPRPKTVVLHQFTGIGDLVWHIPYFKAVAEQSQGGQVSVIAQPSTLARQLIGHEPWVAEIIDHDHRPRRNERRKGRHAGLFGMWRFAQELKRRKFDRIVLFSGRPSRGLLAGMSGIPVRMGYGYRWLQRLFLNCPPFIPRYRGEGVAALHEMAAFAVAHGLASRPLVSRFDPPAPAREVADHRLRRFGEAPLVALAVGTSEPHKQWGSRNFSELARLLVRRGFAVLVLGGPSERKLAQDICDGVSPEDRRQVELCTDADILVSAALLSKCDWCVGNDTGVVHLAAACGTRAIALLQQGRPGLDYHPLLSVLTGPTLERIPPQLVASHLAA